MQVEFEQLPEWRIAGVPHRGAYHRIGEAFERLGPIAGAAGLFGPSTLMVAVYHHDPTCTAEDDLRSIAGLRVSDQATLPSTLEEVRIPAGRYAKAVHRGPYDGLADTWAWLTGQWLSQSGYRMGGGPSFEVYRNDPSTTVKDQLLTELYVSLR
jgi:AraC family transcriptional regulator